MVFGESFLRQLQATIDATPPVESYAREPLSNGVRASGMPALFADVAGVTPFPSFFWISFFIGLGVRDILRWIALPPGTQAISRSSAILIVLSWIGFNRTVAGDSFLLDLLGVTGIVAALFLAIFFRVSGSSSSGAPDRVDLVAIPAVKEFLGQVVPGAILFAPRPYLLRPARRGSALLLCANFFRICRAPLLQVFFRVLAVCGMPLLVLLRTATLIRQPANRVLLHFEIAFRAVHETFGGIVTHPEKGGITTFLRLAQ